MTFSYYANTARNTTQKYGQDAPQNLEKESSLLVPIDHALALLKQGKIAIFNVTEIHQFWLLDDPDLGIKIRLREERKLPSLASPDIAFSWAKKPQEPTEITYTHTVKHKVDSLSSWEVNSPLTKQNFKAILTLYHHKKYLPIRVEKLRYHVVAQGINPSFFYVTADLYPNSDTLRFEFEYRAYFAHSEPLEIPDYFYSSEVKNG